MKKKILLITALFNVSVLYATDKAAVETRTASHSVSISANTEIEILGKYTYLEISTWDKDEVAIEAKITFNGRMTDKVQRFLDDFEENVKGGVTKMGSKLEINTRFDDLRKVDIGGRHFGIKIDYGDKELYIEYEIKLPGTNELEIEGAYKDINMTGKYDDVDISQYSADLQAGTFVNAKLNLKYGDASIDFIETLDLEAYEHDMEFAEVGSMTANAKYSELSIETLNRLDIIGYETDVWLGSAEELEGNLKYGNMDIENELAKADLTLYEFDIDAKRIDNLILTNSKYSKVEVKQANEIRFKESYEDELTVGRVGALYSKSKYGNYSIDELGNSMELNGYEDDITIENVAEDATGLDLDGKYLTLDIELTGTPYSLVTDLKYGKVNYDESKVDVRKYIKENSILKVELYSKPKGENPFQMNIRGYEVDVDLD